MKLGAVCCIGLGLGLGLAVDVAFPSYGATMLMKWPLHLSYKALVSWSSCSLRLKPADWSKFSLFVVK